MILTLLLAILPLTLAQDPAPDPTRAVAEDITDPVELKRTGRWALVIGVNEYSDEGLVDLQFAVNDAEAIATQLQATGGFSAERVVLMVSDHPEPGLRPTRSNVLEQLVRLEARAQGAEQVMVYFSGHGLGVELEGTTQNYLLTEDTRLLIPEDTGLALEDVVRRVQAIDAQQRLLVLDACRNERDRGAKGVQGAQTWTAPQLEGTSGTRVVFSAEFGSVSYEEPQLQSGLFTWYWVDGMRCAADGALGSTRDGVVTLEELFSYTASQLASSPTGRRQVPTKAGESSGDFILAQVTLDCALRLPPPPRLWQSPDLRRGLLLGAGAGTAALGAGLTAMAWSNTDWGRSETTWRLSNNALALASVGLGASAAVLSTRGLLAWRADRAAYDAFIQGSGAVQASLGPQASPLGGAAWGASVELRW